MTDLHKSVLAAEAVDALLPEPGKVLVDGTFGRGGHARAVLERLGPQGRLIVFDKDPAAIAVAASWSEPRLTLCHGSFAELAATLDRLGVARVDGILLDLGVSSPQIDDAARGFSFRNDGPLDMRMDPTSGLSVAAWLEQSTEEELREVVWRYGEERFAKQIARAITAAKSQQPIRTTRQLAQVVATAVRTREPGQDPATRTFQALRIFINQELADLESVLPQCLDRLNPGGRLAVIAFHSLEDRIVKQFMRNAAQPGQMPARLPLRAAELPQPRLNIVGKPIRPTAAEIAANARARSAILRVAERTGA